MSPKFNYWTFLNISILNVKRYSCLLLSIPIYVYVFKYPSSLFIDEQCFSSNKNIYDSSLPEAGDATL